ncbi:MAG: hypothetical protein V4676_09175 [Bacteroidota bacterium]
MKNLYLSCFLLLLFFAGCKSASKSYNKGDYADAIELGVKQLQKDPTDTETKDLVQSAYNFAVAQHEADIRTISNSNSDDRYRQMYQQYLRLQDLYETIYASPVAAAKIKPQNYASFVETYRDKAADVHIERAMALLSQKNKTAYRTAYNELNAALRYKPADRNLKDRRDSAYLAALTKVVVVPLQHTGGYGYSLSYQLQNFQTEIMRTLAQNSSNDFIKFYTEWELRNKNIEPDQVMELNLGRIYLGQPFDKNQAREASKKVVIKETVYKPDSIVKEYATVKARITTTERTLLSEGELFITLRDVNNRIIWNDRFTGQHQWRTQFATYTGDERALSDSDRGQLNNNNQNPPREEEILDELFRKIQTDLAYRLRNYYSRY